MTSSQNSTAFKNNQKVSLQPGRKGRRRTGEQRGEDGKRGREETETRGALSVFTAPQSVGDVRPVLQHRHTGDRVHTDRAEEPVPQLPSLPPALLPSI